MIVRQAAHVVELLEYFAAVRKPATLADITAHFGWPRSSAFNLLSTLVDKGFLYEPRLRAGFYPSPRWLALAQTVVDAQPLPPSVFALAATLTRETGETTVIGAPAGISAIFVHVVESMAAIKYVAQIGHRVPITATATGRAILGQYEPRELIAVLRRTKFERFTHATLATLAAVEAELRASADRGWYQNLGGHAPELFGVAVPLPVAMRRLAVTVAGPRYRMEARMAEVATSIHTAIRKSGVLRDESS